MIGRILIIAAIALMTSISQISGGPFSIQSPIFGLSQLDKYGNLVLKNGSCFGGVDTIPSGSSLKLYGKVAFHNGNLYSKSTIHQEDTSLPGLMNIKDSLGNKVFSIDTTGDVYLNGVCKSETECENTQYEPSVWNTSPVQAQNACYNYAVNKIGVLPALPGLSAYGGRCISSRYNDADSSTPAVLKGRAERDGLIFVGWSFPGNSYDCGNGHLVFGALSEEEDGPMDFHWWRFDQINGTWSQKLGPAVAKNVDESNLTITNPVTSDRGQYSIDAGFYCACESSVVLYHPSDIDCTDWTSKQSAQEVEEFSNLTESSGKIHSIKSGIHLHLPDGKPYSVRIMNMNGRIVSQTTVQGIGIREVSGLRPGTYILEISPPLTSIRTQRITIR